MSGEGPINLNKHRKARARVEKRARADENAVKFGRTRAERLRDRAETDRTARKLDGSRREE